MTDTSVVPAGIDADRPSAARLYDFFLGGYHNFAADRELGRKLLAAEPNLRHLVSENRSFLGRAVRFMIAAGIRQFLDLGSGIPTQDNVHQIAQRGSADARVVYVDNDPVAIAHSKHILASNPIVTAIRADLRDPERALTHPDLARLIDFSQPVGLLMVAVLHFVPDSEGPAGIVGRFAERLARGSYLAISHATYESAPGAAARVEELYKNSTATVQTRTSAQIMPFFAGFDLVDPGLVYLPLWRPDGPPPEHPQRAWIYGGVGRKP